MRAVLDQNVLIASLLSRIGAPAQIITRWLAGEFELVASTTLLAELERALRYPKLRERIAIADARRFVSLLEAGAMIAPDPPHPARRSADPGDDYLIALAEGTSSFLVSGDRHLLALSDALPIHTHRVFLDRLERLSEE